ncbi:MAG TPA: transglutaminaseTgpA domain-containing protein [Cerasibacillus sp.]|uniref:transglutaminase family protein n=1 Tax=Cerasibacillus sp. TaxID=2498711 RepID=UPI002F40F681
MTKLVKQPTVSMWYSSILYFLGFFLFLEWLYPLQQVTDTVDMHVFLGFAAFCFVMTLIQINKLLKFLLKSVGFLFVLHHLFFDDSIFQFVWIWEVIEDVFQHMSLIYHREWSMFSPMFRSLLFLVLIWLMSYLIHYWFVYSKRMTAFILLTFSYIAVLDTFTAYDAKWAIVRIFIFSFIALGMAHLIKEIEREGLRLSLSIKKQLKWMIPIVVIVMFSTFIGYAAPKWDAKWDDPVPYLKGVTGINGKSIKKVGYGEDDSRLGGDFVEDDTPVFQATVQSKQYWRVETKDLYTGKGWKKSSSATSVMEDVVPFSTFNPIIESERMEAMIEFKPRMEIPKLVYPYDIVEVKADDGDTTFLVDDSQAIRVEKGKISQYELTYIQPSYPLDDLKQSEKPNANSPIFDLEEYTQLPEELPMRVRELALEITEPYDTYYDQVKAIEQYFNQNGFVYQTSNIPVPGEEDDYVDQFLFDTKAGYCDNYSTSMVVMLRTLDIPARWVKGFTGGEEVDTVTKADTTYHVYEVTNMNAHSWVEVFFPDVGWVPFEPTQGFSNLANFHTETDAVDEDILEAEPETPELDEETDEQDMPEEQTEDTSAPSEVDGETDTKWPMRILIGSLIIILIVGGIMIYRKRLYLETLWVEKRWERKQDAQAFQNLYHHLLKILQQYDKEKVSYYTLREYASQVDLRYDTNAMRKLTGLYEHVLYRGVKKVDTAEEITQLWKDLIKRIMG